MLSQPESMEAPAPRVAINKVDTRLDRTSYGGTAFLVSLPFIAIGAFFTLAGFLEWEVLKAGANAPLWVIGAVGLIFLLSGLLLFSLAVRGLWSARRQSRLEQRYPGEPWRYDYHWDEFEVRDEAWGRVARGAIGVVVLSVFLVPFVWWAYFSNEGVLPVRIVTGVFILLWLVITGTAIYRVIQYLKFGTSRLILSQFPCRPGDPVRLYLPGDHIEGARCRLRYVEERIEWRGQGKQRTASHLCDEIHGESRAVLDAAGGQGNGAIVEFTLPDNRQWTNSLVAAPTIRYW
ncbi:MAG: hypothetical protein O3B72_08615, partial [Proteobacteria bacterium]|nr:hypothetical protein [Pseudomonadota bacterium]